MKSPITTHILDTAVGKPGVGVPVKLEFNMGQGQWAEIGSGVTNSDGRVPDLLSEKHALVNGTYRITFELSDYYKTQKRASFYPYATIAFQIEDHQQHYHVPLLLSGFGFSTYRGS